MGSFALRAYQPSARRVYQPAALPSQATVLVREAEDGTITLYAQGQQCAARLYPKDHAQLAPGAVVEYPHLDGVFAWIAAQQRERDAARLASPKVTGREKRRLRTGTPLRVPAARME